MFDHRECIIAARNSFVTGPRLAAAATLLAMATIAVPAHGTPASGFVGTVQWEGVFGDMDIRPKTDTFELRLKAKGEFDLVVTRIAIGVGGTSGWHTHPGSSLVTVTGGEITLYDADNCTPTRLRVGQTFVDEGGDHVHLVRNETSSPAQVSVVQMVERNVPRRNDAPLPDSCAASVR